METVEEKVAKKVGNGSIKDSGKGDTSLRPGLVMQKLIQEEGQEGADGRGGRGREKARGHISGLFTTASRTVCNNSTPVFVMGHAERRLHFCVF